MQPTYSPDAEAYREKVQAFLAEKLPSNWQGTGALDADELAEFVAGWRTTLYEAGFAEILGGDHGHGHAPRHSHESGHAH